jgi:hypothetical protein
MKIAIGPYFTLYQPRAEALPTGIAGLGTAVEWASPGGAVQIPLFRHRPGQTTRFGIESVVLRSGDLPCDVTCAAGHVIKVAGMSFVPLEAVLAALYRSEGRRPLRDLLRELVSMVPLQASFQNPAPAGGLIPAAEKKGYRLATAARDGEDILIELAWRPAENASLLHVVNGAMDSRSPEKGAWIESPIPGVSALLADELHRLLPGPPGKILSDGGRQYLNSLHSIH